jgi:putative ATP-binding cassette transporter
MQTIAALVAVFSLAAAVVAGQTGEVKVWLLAGAALLCAVTTFRSQAISSFLRIFAAMFAAETFVFGSLFLATQIGVWPEDLADYAIPETLPLSVAIFAILVYSVSFIPVVRKMTGIADRFFDTDDRTAARIWPLPSFVANERTVAIAMVVFLVLVNQAQVGMQVRLSFFSRDWFNAIQNKDEAEFWAQLFTVFVPWAFIYITSAVIEYVVKSTLIIRWRRWLTDNYVGRWLDRHTHYRMSLGGGLADNPDQRISEDINRFIDGGEVGYGIYSFSILLIATLSSLVSFSIVLWDLSANFTLPYTSIAVPGFLFWTALIYAGIGTLVTHLIGRPLVRLAFAQQRYEADFRFSLARLREYSEQVALLGGERNEKSSFASRFAAIIRNYFAIIDCRKKLTAFTAFYGQLSPIIPFVVAAPFYFLGKITLGIMTQTASAFGRVEAALTFFINYYVSLAEFKAVLDRLLSFDEAIGKAQAFDGLIRPEKGEETAAIDFTALTLSLPTGRPIVKNVDLELNAAEPALVTGPSGSGKSTLFRAVSGIWPFGEGMIRIPKGAKVLLLPQKPYIPIGSLRAAVTYPAPPESYDDETIRAVMIAVQLDGLIDELDSEDIWSQRLSGGEQQRLAIARALLAKPDWLFLDEATSAMDETMETKIYESLAEHLPETTIISIGHRPSLNRFHKRRIHMHPEEPGVFVPVEITAKAAE